MEPQDGFLRSSRSSPGAFQRSGMLVEYSKHVQEMEDSAIFLRPGPLVPFQRVINGYPERPRAAVQFFKAKPTKLAQYEDLARKVISERIVRQQLERKMSQLKCLESHQAECNSQLKCLESQQAECNSQHKAEVDDMEFCLQQAFQDKVYHRIETAALVEAVQHQWMICREQALQLRQDWDEIRHSSDKIVEKQKNEIKVLILDLVFLLLQAPIKALKANTIQASSEHQDAMQGLQDQLASEVAHTAALEANLDTEMQKGRDKEVFIRKLSRHLCQEQCAGNILIRAVKCQEKEFRMKIETKNTKIQRQTGFIHKLSRQLCQEQRQGSVMMTVNSWQESELQNLEQQVKSLQDQLQGKANRIDILESELGTERATTKEHQLSLAAIKQELADERSKSNVLDHLLRHQGTALNRSLCKSRILADGMEKARRAHFGQARQLEEQQAAYDRNVRCLQSVVATHQQEAERKAVELSTASQKLAVMEQRCGLFALVADKQHADSSRAGAVLRLAKQAISALHSQLDSKEMAVTTADGVIISLRKDVAALRSQVSDKDFEASHATTVIGSLRKHITDLTTQKEDNVMTFKQQIKKLQEQLQQKANLITGLQSQIAQAQEIVKAERDTSSGLQQQAVELQQSSNDVRQQLKQAAEANRNMTTQLETARAASKTAIKDAKKDVESMQKELKRKISALEKQNRDLLCEKQAAEAHNEEIMRLYSEHQQPRMEALAKENASKARQRSGSSTFTAPFGSLPPPRYPPAGSVLPLPAAVVNSGQPSVSAVPAAMGFAKTSLPLVGSLYRPAFGATGTGPPQVAGPSFGCSFHPSAGRGLLNPGFPPLDSLNHLANGGIGPAHPKTAGPHFAPTNNPLAPPYQVHHLVARAASQQASRGFPNQHLPQASLNVALRLPVGSSAGQHADGWTSMPPVIPSMPPVIPSSNATSDLHGHPGHGASGGLGNTTNSAHGPMSQGDEVQVDNLSEDGWGPQPDDSWTKQEQVAGQGKKNQSGPGPNKITRGGKQSNTGTQTAARRNAAAAQEQHKSMQEMPPACDVV